MKKPIINPGLGKVRVLGGLHKDKVYEVVRCDETHVHVWIEEIQAVGAYLRSEVGLVVPK